MNAQSFVWAYSPLERPEAEVGCIVASGMDDAREKLRKQLDPMGGGKWTVDELNQDTICGKLKQGKKTSFWIITDPVELGTMGDQTGKSARAFIEYAESSDSRRGPWVSRAQTVAAAVSAFLSDQSLNLASGDPVDELPQTATALRLPLSKAT